MASRPVYVPRKSRARGRGSHFHGAFTGGFSAGFFNTVGSAEGWQPQQQQQPKEDLLNNNNNSNDELEETAPRIQRPEDFMDEQDHDEWGGPVAVRPDYKDSSDATKNQLRPAWEHPPAPTDVLWSVDRAPKNVGHRLLRLLGWREGQSTAYVPDEASSTANVAPTTAATSNTTPVADETKFLSQKRLRKIRLQQQRVHIPHPKLDTCALGYEPYQNAPEFKRHGERRRKLAQERAQPSGRSVYRVSNILGNKDDDEDGPAVRDRLGNRGTASSGEPYVSFETVQDFVGSKSVGGFALREDEDDAYDDQPLTKMSDKVRVDTDAFDTVAYEHESDDEPTVGVDDETGIDFGGALSLWANASKPVTTTTAATDTRQTSRGVTADGKPPLKGFVLGGANAPNQNQRFRGPDLPEHYQIQRHVFAPDDHPLVLKALSQAVQLQAADERRKEALQEAMDANARSIAPTRVKRAGPIAGTAFIELGQAMKSRFTASKGSTETRDGDAPLVPGLSFVKTGESDAAIATEPSPVFTLAQAKPEIKITRNIVPFAPEALLCRRFHVRMPMNVAVANYDSRTTGESYFQEEILKKAGVLASSGSSKSKASNKDDFLGSLNEAKAPGDAHKDRPAMAIYKAIFEPESEEESSESEDEELAEGNEQSILSVAADQNHSDTAVSKEAAGESRLVPYSKLREPTQLVDGGESRDRRNRRRSRSADSSGESSDDRDRRKRRKKDVKEKRRHRDDKKKKKRKKKSSKRKHE